MTDTPIENQSANCPICNSIARYDFSSRDLMFDRYDRYDYFKCTNCSSTFLYPMPDMETIGTFYPAHYTIYDEDSQQRKVGKLKQAILRRNHGYTHLTPPWPYILLASLLSPFHKLNTLDYIEGGKLLDVGCGNGRFLMTMRSFGWDVQGVELSENGVKVCHAAKLPVHHGDLASASFSNAGFDLITVRHVIEHIPEPHAFMVELARILKPGGHLVIETPNSEALGRQWLGPNWFANEVPRHLILYNRRSLSLLAARYGLKTLTQHLDSTPKIFLNSIDYVLKNRGKPSKRIWWRRVLARLYVAMARRSKRGDVIHAVFSK